MRVGLLTSQPAKCPIHYDTIHGQSAAKPSTWLVLPNITLDYIKVKNA